MKVEMNPAQTFEEQLAVLESTSLRRRPPIDDQIAISSKLAEGFEGMSASEREASRKILSDSTLAKKLLSLSGYIAEVAISLNRPELLRIGLVLHTIEGLEHDYRENMRYLILIAFAARKLGVALRPLINSVIVLAPEPGRVHLDEFSHREIGPNLLRSFGLKADDTPGAFRFIPAT